MWSTSLLLNLPLFVKIRFSSDKNIQCQVWMKLVYWIFKFHQCIFAISVWYPPWKKTGPFICTNLILHHPRTLCVKFSWNWFSGSGEEDENVKSLQTDRQIDRQTDRLTMNNRRSVKLTWAFSCAWKLVKFLSDWNTLFKYHLDRILRTFKEIRI